MPDKYYQEYGPIRRRRMAGELETDDPQPAVGPRRGVEPIEIEGEALLARPARRRLEQMRRRKRRRQLFAVVALALLATGGFVALPYALGLFGGGRAPEGVSLHGQPVAGMGRDEIRAQLDRRYAQFLRAPLTIAFEGRSWTPTLDQIGVRFDLDAAADEAVAAGHRGGPLERAQELWAIWRGGLDIAPRLSVDASKLQAYLSGIALELDRPPRDAALSVAEGKVIPTAALPGRQVLADATTLDVLRAIQTLTPQTVTLRTRALTPRLTDAAIAPAIADARALLSGPLTLRHGQESWTWEPAKVAELISVTAADGQMRVGIDKDRLARAVEKLAQVVDTGTAEPRVAFANAKLKIAQPGATGWRLQQGEATTAISEALRLARRDLALPVAELSPQVTAKTLPSLGIVELVGEGKSSFAGSAPYRITNIKAGAARLNGVLIAPGAEFSFNTQLGEVDERNGFVKGYAVIGQRTQLEWGGGVCQDSTTLFRAAFWAGLPITERHAHPFYISWYDDFSFPDRSGPGMDAAIYTGVQDFKFLNDTGRWLLLEATVNESAQVLTVRLYGTKPNRTVAIKGPDITRVTAPPPDPVYVSDDSLPAGEIRQTDHARKGMDVTVYRVITENGVQKPPEAFFTRFKAWPDVFVKGTGQ